MNRDGVVGLVAHRIGLIVADHQIGFRAQQFEQQRRQPGVAMVEGADMPWPGYSGVNRRKAVQRHQHRRNGITQAPVDYLMDAAMVGIEDRLPPRLCLFTRKTFVTSYCRGFPYKAARRSRAMRTM